MVISELEWLTFIRMKTSFWTINQPISTVWFDTNRFQVRRTDAITNEFHRPVQEHITKYQLDQLHSKQLTTRKRWVISNNYHSQWNRLETVARFISNFKLTNIKIEQWKMIIVDHSVWLPSHSVSTEIPRFLQPWAWSVSLSLKLEAITIHDRLHWFPPKIQPSVTCLFFSTDELEMFNWGLGAFRFITILGSISKIIASN